MSETTTGPCRYCKILLGHLAVVVRERGELDEFEAWLALRSHLARKHPAELPGYVANCASCTEWKALTPHVRPNLLATLAAEAALHRAGHRIVAQEDGEAGLRVGIAPLEEGGAFVWAPTT